MIRIIEHPGFLVSTIMLAVGFGIVLVAVAGALLYKQIPDFPAMIGMGLIISGVVVIHVFSKTVSH